ncbi:MAG: TonB-dependent receptor [Thermaurantimonas sp.]|uniref:TonB-dependent receptor n=1 Tax=Thermaurantimonas sp. TaxID=2681568 RepID=UPI00391B894C
MERYILTTQQKALKINLNSQIYGTFAEIGAGQEVVRHFFRAGGASGTVAKAMSAYDKDFSDAIYGREPDGRYVTESRLRKMLAQEYRLVEERIDRSKNPDKCFFTYANTVATIDFAKRYKGHGWMGCKFQLTPDSPPNEVIFHVRLKENEAVLQQETIGIMGVNLIYACFHIINDPNELLKSLYDNLSRDKVEIDMINVSGPDFEGVDNRLLSLQLIKNGFTDAVIFGPDGNNLLPAGLLYKKNILALRGSFRPVTKVNMDMMKKGYEYFLRDPKVKKDNVEVLFEITLNNLRAEGEIDEQDFLDRAEILCSLGYKVLISNFQEYYKLVHYFSEFTKARMGIILGVSSLKDVFNEKYYRSLPGGILEAMGIMFSRDLKIYVYPSKPTEDSPLETTQNMWVHPRLRPLFEYLTFNGRIKDIETYDPNILHIFSPRVLRMIKKGEPGWGEMLPEGVEEIIRSKHLFGYKEVEAPAENV